MKKLKLAIVGATGAVGQELLEILKEENFELSELRLLGSAISQGKSLEFQGRTYKVEELSADSFAEIDAAFFSAGATVSKEFAPIAASAGAVVVDNSSAFRMDPDVPLVVPEVNPEAISEIPKRRIISVPNCAVIQMVMALDPLHEKWKLKRVIVSTYQSTSGAGRRAMDEFLTQIGALMNQRPPEMDVFPYQIAFNVIPQIGDFLESEMTGEEEKLVEEPPKILGIPDLEIAPTAVRVPTLHSHGESIWAEFEKDVDVSMARKLLDRMEGVRVVDDVKKLDYPTPVGAAGQNDVLVGRIRKDPFRSTALQLWVVGDNLRKGAALNALQIIQELQERELL